MIIIEYKGYEAKIEYSVEDMSYVGHVLGIKDYLLFDGDTIEEAIDMFHDNIDDYIIVCVSLGRNPEIQ